MQFSYLVLPARSSLRVAVEPTISANSNGIFPLRRDCTFFISGDLPTAFNPAPHRRNTPGSRCSPLEVSGLACK